MSLRKYEKKRDFTKSTEPKKSKKAHTGALNFCVQKHDASHLHYDFRLECDGVLLSWAVPKGVSLNPQDKRLAIHVEDHPLDYQYFEGIIPKGNYGAGTVEIFDHGTYTTPHSDDRNEIEKEIETGLKKGHFAFILHGEKLNGEFILEKLKKKELDDTSWLLIKKDDDSSEKKSPNEKRKIVNTKMPDFIPPMLATLALQSFDNKDWLFEIKWDGFRALSFINKNQVQLKSRNKLTLNEKFPSILAELKKIKGNVILDGEIVVVDKKGRADFQLMQNYKNSQDNALVYYVFDIIYKDSEDLRDLPLIERKEILKKFLSQLDSPFIRFSDHVLEKGKQLFKAAKKERLEGIIGKKITSVYESRRSKDWVKIKNHASQEILICGFTKPRGAREKFGAIIAGVYDKNKKLQFAGHVGGGFDASLLNDVYKKMEPLIVKKCPFESEPKVNMPVTWVKPKLIAEVIFSDWTKDNIMRQPIFKGLRTDKNDPKEIGREVALAIPKEKSRDLVLTHLDKIYWPKEKITKGDLIAYYEKIAPYILPYLKDRPIMLHRYPEGITGQDFYQKDLKFTPPSGIKTFALEQEGKINHYLLIDNVESLLYAVNLGSIDLHPFLAHIKNLQNPDYCVIDLDPHEIAFSKVIEAALVLHEILEELKVKHFIKTSGGNGLHILIPLSGKYDFDQSRQFAEIICHLVNQKLLKTTSLERSPEKRKKKIYLDCLQNRISQSIVAPYSVRPRPKALVSTPLEWSEVGQDLDVSKYTMEEVLKRLDKMGDIFKPLLKGSVNIAATLKKIKRTNI